LTTLRLSGHFQDNDALIEWVNPACLTNHLFRDGHDGVWNIIDEIAPNGERREILDWYHLMENLHKVGGSLKRLRQAETLLWQGKLMRQRLCLLIAPLNKLRILSTTSTSTVTASSTTSTTRQNRFVLALGR